MPVTPYLFGCLRLPIFEQGADVFVVEVEVGEFAAEVDGAVDFAGLGETDGEEIGRFLPKGGVAGGEVLQSFLEVALGQPPVVTRLEAQAEVEDRLAVLARIVTDGLQLLDRLVELA